MTIKIKALTAVVKWLVGGELLKAVLELVEAVNNTNQSGEAKRAYVQKKIKKLFAGSASFFINLAIEVAVISLNERIKNGS